MPVQSWSCPACRQSFIVDAEATKDTCPWCHATVERSGDALKLVAEPTSPQPEAPKPAPEPSGSPAAATQSGWPFEYSS